MRPRRRSRRASPKSPAERFARAFQLVLPDGRVLEGAEAVLALAGRVPGGDSRLALYRRIPGVAPLLELAYRLVARHRPAAMAVTRMGVGIVGPRADLRSRERPLPAAARALLSRRVRVAVGPGRRPRRGPRHSAGLGVPGVGPRADGRRPLTGSCRRSAGSPRATPPSTSSAPPALAVSLLLVAGLVPAWSALAAWGLYLSLSIAGQQFLEFQWDVLLTEAGLLAVFLAPPALRLLRRRLASPRLARFLLVWLLFRLMLSSGAVKLVSHDPAWRSLTALRVHYETQPLPPWTAWFVHQLSPAFQTASCVFLFFVELAVPFLYFAPRRLRLFACAMTILLQVLIASTGNYAFFNLLTIALAVLLVDDVTLRRRAPAVAGAPARTAALASRAPGSRRGPPPCSLGGPVPRLDRTSLGDPGTAHRRLSRDRPAAEHQRLRTLRRDDDRAAGDRRRGQRRRHGLEALRVPLEAGRPDAPAPVRGARTSRGSTGRCGSPRSEAGTQSPWLGRMLAGLLEGSPPSRRFSRTNPFAGRPPRYLRTMLYDYRFTDAAERRRTGAWWRRRALGPYGPVLERPWKSRRFHYDGAGGSDPSQPASRC